MLRARRRTWMLGARSRLGCAVLSLVWTPVAAQTPETAAHVPDPGAGRTLPGAVAPRELPADPRLPALDRRSAEVERLLARAHFRTALGLARKTLAGLDESGDALHPDPRRARLEVMAATAEIALGRRDGARESLARALRADPALELDASEVSPKVLELLREARLARGGEEEKP